MKELAARISGAELDVLEVLWQAEGPMPIADVRGALEQSHSWDSSTVKTLLRRLCEKKAVEAEKREVFYYRPLLSRREYQIWSTRSLIDKVYRGSARSLVAALVERSQLSREDLAELEALLRQAGFRQVRQYGELRFRAPREGEQRIFFAARKEF